jgi:protein-tyrosine phosphatase
VIITPTPFERLFVGSLRAAERLAEANPLGIRTIVSVCAEKIQSRCPDVTYVQFPMVDAQPLRFEMVDEVMQTIARNIIAGGVLIHCAVGLSRSPVMVALYFDPVGFRSLDAALDELARLRAIDPSPIIVRSAKEYLKMRYKEAVKWN